MAMWNQSAIGGFWQPASARIDCRPEQPSVNAVNPVWRLGRPLNQRADLRIGLRHGAKHLPATAGGLDIANANLQMPPPSRQPRMNVESRVMVIADASAAGMTVAAVRSCSPILSVWPRNVSGLLPNDRQEVLQQASGDAIRHQSRNMCSQLVELGCGSAI
jgi:hypothetical protein